MTVTDPLLDALLAADPGDFEAAIADLPPEAVAGLLNSLGQDASSGPSSPLADRKSVV